MAALAVGEKRVAAEIVQAVARHLNCLNDENKITRKKALESIRKETLHQKVSSLVLQEVFTILLKPLLKCLSDPMEKCRETAIQMISDFIRNTPEPQEALPYFITTVAQRLGSQDIVEPAEELRLALVEVLTLTVEVCGESLAPYLDDMVRILQRTIVDPFPDVKKESCKCAANYAKCIPEHFHMAADLLIKPLMQTISHQHSKVRVSVIQATGTVMQYGNGKSMDDVLSHLAQRLFDNSPQVRLAVTNVVGAWLLDLRDRYSYFHKLIPLLLSSFSDEIPEIRLLAGNYWKKIGCQWQQENEEDLKDKLDFLTLPPPHYPPGVERPVLGCRELIFRNLSKILPAISRDITDWVVGNRIKSSELLGVLLLHAEEHITQHMELLLSMLYRACSDEEKQVVKNCLNSAELIGTFVNPEVFLKMILTSLLKSPSPAHLMVLAAVIRGSSGQTLKPHLVAIGDMLSNPDACQASEKLVYTEKLGCCVQALITQCGPDCREISLQLLKVLVTIQSLSPDEELHDKVLEILGCLSALQGLHSVSHLYRQHMAELMEWLAASQHNWTSFSVERLQFETIVIQSGPIIGEALHMLIPILKTCLQPSRDPEMRLQLLTVLSKLLLNASETVNSQGEFPNYLEPFLKDIVVPNLLWHAGRTAAAIRTSAISCLWALLHSGALSGEQMWTVQNDLLPLVIATLDEDSKMTREMACRIINAVLKLCGDQFDPDGLNKVYPELLKRLDDACNGVRCTAAKALSSWFQCVREDYDRTTFRSHLEFLYRGLLVHLDDPDSSIQTAMFDVLKQGSVVDPSLLEQEIEAVKHKHRTSSYCEQLLQHIQLNTQASTGRAHT
ncbi:dynein assembly factor 5, axonemal-like [Acipenser oxyrinchus oxyrinchus]|uniref:Dynein assembly factor 5, axonemal-like n=1 Tax=Acipenser oxyrinchus oxyrinchus TaxID=40147 RepID=A0AAD8D8Y4_ACIOX|nr:dynein assembly factor 5, axonemal-like [Acipenser oxyrinchus oxyrinchus]